MTKKEEALTLSTYGFDSKDIEEIGELLSEMLEHPVKVIELRKEEADQVRSSTSTTIKVKNNGN